VIERGARAALPLLFILALVTALYWNTLDNELTYWDDNRYVTVNERIRDVSPAGVVRIFNPWDIMGDKGATLDEYLPLTTLTHAIVYHFSGLNPVGYHIANLLLYLADIVLLYYFLSYLLDDHRMAFLATLIFAVHPAHVESVAWVAATKDVLSLPFLIGAMHLYVRYDRGEGREWPYYAASLAVFFVGLLAKSLIVTLPVLLILYDLCFGRKKIRLLDKIPYFAIGVLLSILYVKVNQGFVTTKYLLSDTGLYVRALMTLKVGVEYLRMIFVPVKLNAFYNYGPADVPASFFEPGVLISFAVLAAIGAAGLYFLRKGPRIAAFCIFWFFIPFIPVINLFVASSTLRADRYLFIPSMGFSILAAWAVCSISERNAAVKKAALAAFAVVVGVYSVLTFQRGGVWQSGITLWQDSISKQQDSALVYSLLGNEYRHRGRYDEAIEQYRRAIEVDPTYENACNSLGGMYGMTGRTAMAIKTFERCLESTPGSTKIKVNLARGYALSGQNTKAYALVMEVLKAEPDNRDARAVLGLLR